MKKRFVCLSTLLDGTDVMELCEITGEFPGKISSVYGSTHCTADLPGRTQDFPLVVPRDGTRRSFFKTAFLRMFDWECFCDLLGGITRISNISIFCDYSVFGPCSLISDQWQLSKYNAGGIVIGQRDNGEHGLPLDKYVQATGVIGVTGDPLEKHPYYRSQDAPIRKIDCYNMNHRCIIDRQIYKSNFLSRAMVSQVLLPATAVFGAKPPIEVYWSAEVW